LQYFDYIMASLLTLGAFWFFYSKTKKEERRLKRDNVIDNFSFKSLKK